MPIDGTKHIGWLVVLAVGVTFAFGLLLLFLFTIRQVIYSLFFSVVVAAALRPSVLALSRRVPYLVALAAVYLSLLTALALALVTMVPIVVAEVTNFINSLPQLVEAAQPALSALAELVGRFGVRVDTMEQVGGILAQTSGLLPEVIALPRRIFDAVLGVFSVIALSFYWLLAHDRIIHYLVSFLPSERRGAVVECIRLTEDRLGAYVSGLLLTSLVIGVLAFIGLSLLGVRFALLLAVLAGALEVVPILGPIIAGIPIVLIAASQSLLLGVATLIFLVVVQQLEGYVVAPMIQQKVVGLSPFVILVVILVGASVAGVTGALIALPAALVLATVLDQLKKNGQLAD